MRHAARNPAKEFSKSPELLLLPTLPRDFRLNSWHEMTMIVQPWCSSLDNSESFSPIRLNTTLYRGDQRTKLILDQLIRHTALQS
jgi:hypothetical protein